MVAFGFLGILIYNLWWTIVDTFFNCIWRSYWSTNLFHLFPYLDHHKYFWFIVFINTFNTECWNISSFHRQGTHFVFFFNTSCLLFYFCLSVTDTCISELRHIPGWILIAIISTYRETCDVCLNLCRSIFGVSFLILLYLSIYMVNRIYITFVSAGVYVGLILVICFW